MEATFRSLTLQLTQISDQIISQPEAVNSQSKELMELVRAVDRFAKLTKGPMDYVMGLMTTMTQFTALRLFNEWNAADHIPVDDAISYEELAAKLDADVSLITRLSWNLVAAGMLKQVGTDKVTQTAIFKALSTAPYRVLIQLGYDTHLRTICAALEYFSANGRREPASRYNTIYAFAAGDPNLTVWEHMNRNESRMQNFMASMAIMTQAMPMVGSYDFHWVLDGLNDHKRTLIVDVGGGSGHALEVIHKATPGLPLERCAVEDLPPVVEEARRLAKGDLKRTQFIEADFHKGQPIKGALIYYIRRCLHDYGDQDCVQILQHIRSAMLPDSKCLIMERIMSNPPTALDASTDLFMATLGGKERTIDGFRSIINQAGLDIDKVYGSGENELSVIECSVA